MASSIPVSAPAPRALKRLPAPLRRATTVLAAAFLAVVVFAALFAPVLTPYHYSQYRGAPLAEPSPAHPLGTDEHGRDELSRILHGARVSLTVAVGVEAIELLFGLTLGMVAGLKRGRLDSGIMRLTDLMFAFPDILLAILITGMLGKSLVNVFLALALVGWPGMVRLVRSQVLALSQREFVEAARTMGASDVRIMLRHLLPNITGPIMVAATVDLGSIVLAESTLSFLGLGIQPPFPSWGSMISQGWELHRAHPMLTLYPALCLAGTIMAFNFLGDGLRDWLDPRSRFQR